MSSPSSPSLSANSWKRGFSSVLAAEFLAVIGFNASVPIIPFYIQDLGVTDVAAVNLWVGVCSTATAVTLAVFAPIWGRMADSFGKRTMLLRAMIGGGIVMGVMGMVTHPWQLAVLRGFQGALSGTVAAATVLVATLAPREDAGYAMGLLQTAIYLGSSLGPAVGGLVSDLLGRRANFFFTSGLLFAAAFIILRYVPRDIRTALPPGSLWGRIRPDFSALAGSRYLISLLVIAGMEYVATSVTSPILPLFIQSLSPGSAFVGSMTGFILGLTALSTALAAAGLGRISRRVGYERMIVFCLAGAFLLALPQAFVRTPLQLLALRVIGGVFFGGTLPSINALLAYHVKKDKQGTVYGLSSGINATGAAVGPMVGASIAVGLGYSSSFFVTAGLLLAAAVGARLLIRPR